VSILELEELAGIPDVLPWCPVKLAEMTGFTPVAPVPVDDTRVDLTPRQWQYRVCGIEQGIRGA
jgi:hypothetical protein